MLIVKLLKLGYFFLFDAYHRLENQVDRDLYFYGKIYFTITDPIEKYEDDGPWATVSKDYENRLEEFAEKLIGRKR